MIFKPSMSFPVGSKYERLVPKRGDGGLHKSKKLSGNEMAAVHRHIHQEKTKAFRNNTNERTSHNDRSHRKRNSEPSTSPRSALDSSNSSKTEVNFLTVPGSTRTKETSCRMSVSSGSCGSHLSWNSEKHARSQNHSAVRSASASHVDNLKRRTSVPCGKIYRAKSSNNLIPRRQTQVNDANSRPWASSKINSLQDTNKVVSFGTYKENNNTLRTLKLPKIVASHEEDALSDSEDAETKVRSWLATIDVDISRRYARKLMAGMSTSEEND